MCEQIGTPTFFFTLSAADYHWKDIFRLIDGNTPYESISELDKKRLMHENPMIVANYFQLRAQKFMKHVMPALFNVQDYWYRFEWQARGSAHVHGLIWCHDAPCINEKDMTQNQIDNIVEYFDSKCLALNPIILQKQGFPCRVNFSDIPNEERENDLINLINNLQRHTFCGSHCYRWNKKQSKFLCRYKFPKETQDESTVKKDNGYYVYSPARDDPYVQRYNPLITKIWRANTDYSPILSLIAVLRYIAKYTSKGEVTSNNYKNLLNDIFEQGDNDTSAMKAISKIMMSVSTERDFSAQEVFHLMMG